MKQMFDIQVVQKIIEKVEACDGNLDLDDENVCNSLGLTRQQAQAYFFQIKTAGFIVVDDRYLHQIVSPSLLWKALQSLNAFDNTRD